MLEKALEEIAGGASPDMVFDKYSDRLVDISKPEFKRMLEAYSNLRLELEGIGGLAEEAGLGYEISISPVLSFHFEWESGENGLWITFSKDGHPSSTLLAMPLIPMSTTTYGPYYFGGTPPAADLIKVTEHMMLFVSHESAPPEELLNKLMQEEQDIPDLVPMLVGRRRGALVDFELTDPACVDVAAEPSDDEIAQIVFDNLPGVHAVGICIAGYPNKKIITR